jgi:hypothetical protein
VLLTEQERDRARVEPKYTWNLADIFPDVAAWRTAKARVQAEMPQIATFAGTLGSSPQALADALDLRARLDKELSRLYVYASMMPNSARWRRTCSPRFCALADRRLKDSSLPSLGWQHTRSPCATSFAAPPIP